MLRLSAANAVLERLIADVTALIVCKLKVLLICHYAHRDSVAADWERDALQLHNNNEKP